jgi:hypothetical protein
MNHILIKYDSYFFSMNHTGKSMIHTKKYETKVLHSGSDLKKSGQIQKNRKFDIRLYNLFFKTSTLGVSENV